MRIQPKGKAVYQLKVTLSGVKPPIWRRFLVPSGITLAQLHGVLQVVMGWTNSHLHKFIAKGVIYELPDAESYGAHEDERRSVLEEILTKPKDRLTYKYDFGDNWEHEVVLEAVAPFEVGARYPCVVAGKRACPPEDVGGVWGYADLLATLGEPDDPEREEMLEWVGESFNPEAFNANELNVALHGGWLPPESKL
ncbi:MAG: plasmid pRiA4b ORF-3 family protein [Candidatus Eisenbacteria bacterium]|nr:plasmid pRiA4b ORF-3 family protein [Candidatus Eisenbacteria bacterium]